jgi:hypothetical protein
MSCKGKAALSVGDEVLGVVDEWLTRGVIRKVEGKEVQV